MSSRDKMVLALWITIALYVGNRILASFIYAVFTKDNGLLDWFIKRKEKKPVTTELIFQAWPIILILYKIGIIGRENENGV